MGFLDSVRGGSSESNPTGVEPAERKYAILLNAGPDDTPTAGNGFTYALELDSADHEVQVFLDGEAARWPGAFAENPERPFSTEWERLRERGLLAGACGYCANAFDAAEACERSGVPLLSDSGQHAPAVAQLADEGYELLTIG